MAEIPILKKMMLLKVPVGASRKQNSQIAAHADKIKDALRRFHQGDKDLNKGNTTIVATLAELE